MGKKKISFLINLDIMLIAYNCSAIITAWSFTEILMIQHTEDESEWDYEYLEKLTYVGLFSTTIRDSSFITAHWIFATKIWSLSRELPLLLKKEDHTEVLEQNTKIYRAGFFVSITLPVIYNIDYTYWYINSLK